MDAANLRGRAGNCRGERHERGVRVLCPALHAHVACLRCMRRWADRLTRSQVGMSERRAANVPAARLVAAVTARIRFLIVSLLPSTTMPFASYRIGCVSTHPARLQDRASCRFSTRLENPAALRWHSRYCADVADVGFEEVQAVLACSLVAQFAQFGSTHGRTLLGAAHVVGASECSSLFDPMVHRPIS